MGGAIFLPTLGVGMEQALLDDPPALLAAFRAFNRWLDEDWGFAYQERIFAAPMLTIVDPDEAVKTVQWSLDHDARFFVLVPGPVDHRARVRSPPPTRCSTRCGGCSTRPARSSPRTAATPTTRATSSDWGEGTEMEAFRQNPFRAIVSWSAVQDWFANLLAHGLFQRFPNLRMASIETGSDWVFHLFDKLKKSYSQTPYVYPEDPRETFRRHVWVSPYYEDDLAGLRDLIGADHMLMGSDYPHAEGPRRPEHVHQGPRELRLHAPRTRAGDARQRATRSRSAVLRDDTRLALGGHLQDRARHAHRPGRAVRAARGRGARRAHARVRQPARFDHPSCCRARPNAWATSPT